MQIKSRSNYRFKPSRTFSRVTPRLCQTLYSQLMIPSAVIGCIPESNAPNLHAFTLALARTQHQQNYVYLEEEGV